MTAESNVESRHECHFKVDSQLDAKRAAEEVQISENGPYLIRIDKLLFAAINK